MRRGARRIPRAGWLCALAGLCVALAWGWITPPFQVPDENAHVAYVQHVAQTGELPVNRPGGDIAPEEQGLLQGLDFYGVVGRPDNKPAWTRRADERVREAEGAGFDRVGDNALTAANNPPLYYLAQVVPYWLSPSHDLLDRLALMRIVSALMAALSVLLCFLFVREVLPGEPWAWSVGGLVVAFQPLFGFLSGGVNNDDGLVLASAAMFLLLARCLRRGIDVRRGVALGLVTAAGLLAKTNFAAFLPAMAVGVVVMLWRARAARRGGAEAAEREIDADADAEERIEDTSRGQPAPRSRAGVLALVASAAIPIAAYLVALRTVWVRPVNNAVGGLTSTPGGKAYNVLEQLSYAWQLYLPKLPFMTKQFGDALPLSDLWVRGWIGRFGWLDTGFPNGAYLAAWIVIDALVVLLVLGLLRAGPRLWARRGEALTYLVAVAGLLAVIAFAGYRARVDTGQPFEQARYLLPLLPLYGLAIVLAARAVGRRWAPALGAFLVVLAAGHTLLSQLLVLGRFYG